MRKTTFVIGIFLAIFASCGGNNWEDSIITNNSDYPVKFKFYHTGEKSLAKGESVVFETRAYQQMESYSPEKRVYFAYESTNDGYTGEFKPRQSWDIIVNNTTEEDVTLCTSDWIKNEKWIDWIEDGNEWKLDDSEEAGYKRRNTWMDKMENIPHGDTDDESHRGIIYTENPVFIVTRLENESVPVIAVANYNQIGSTFWVTIHTFP
jgi:hypothetical protein